MSFPDRLAPMPERLTIVCYAILLEVPQLLPRLCHKGAQIAYKQEIRLRLYMHAKVRVQLYRNGIEALLRHLFARSPEAATHELK